MKKLLGLCFSLMFFASCGFEVVDDGYVGVKTILGKVEKDEYLPGIHFYNPLTTGIKEMSIRENTWTDKVSTYSFDNQIIDVDFKVNYAPEATMMAELFIEQGPGYVNVILPQRVSASIKEIMGKYKATEVTAIRGRITSEISALIKEKLNGTKVKLQSIELVNFDYDDAFEAAVRAKVVAKERAIEEENKTVQIKEQAKQKIEMARATAEAIKQEAAALRENKSIVELRAVEKWNGVLPQYMLGNSTPFLNFK